MKNTVRRWLVCFMLVYCFFIAPFPCIVFAAENEQVIRVGYFDFNGMISKNQDGIYEGFTVDYLNRIAEKTGWKYEFVEDSWVNLLLQLEKGELDLVCNVQYTNKRSEKFSYSKFPIADEFSVLYSRKNDDTYCYNEIEAFDGMRVGAIKGAYQTRSFMEYAKKNGFNCEMILYDTAQEVLDGLNKGHVDSVAITLQKNPYNTKIIAKFDALPSYFIAPKGQTKILDRMNSAVEDIKISSPFFEKKFYLRHFEENEIESQMSLTREELNFVQNASKIKVAVPVDRRPLSFIDKNDNQLKGIMVDTIRLLGDKVGLEFEIFPIEEQKNLLSVIDNLEYDIIFPVSDAPVYRSYSNIKLSERILETSLGIMTIGDEKFNINEAHDIALQEDLLGTHSKLRAEYPNLRIVKMDDYEQSLKALKTGKVDAIVNNVYVLNYLLQDPHYEGVSMVPNIAIDIPYCIGVRKDLPKEFISILNKGIYSISQRELEQIVINYTINNEYDYTIGDHIYKNRTLILVVALFVALIMAIFAFYNHQKVLHYKIVEKKNAELVRANIAKTEFLSRMSHEIRTPLGVIKGMNDIINHNIDDYGCVKDSSDKIKIAASHLLQIINDVLDMSKIGEGKMELTYNVFNLEDEIKIVDTVYNTAAMQHGITLKTKIELDNKYFVGDILRIKQVIINLLSNAIKYNKSIGKIELVVQSLISTSNGAKRIIRFTVEDTGKGIRRENLENIFYAFEREKSSTTSMVSGTGLGLSISSEIVQLMGSKINVSSTLGEGSKFWFDLELPVASAEEIQLQNKHDMDVSKLKLNGLRCLVVDDNFINTTIVKRLLESTGAVVETADSGITACEKFEKSPVGYYFAILIDIRMPVMDGHEAAKYIRSLPREDSQRVKIIALSANAFKEDKQKSLECGMNAHCSKPIEREQILKALLD